MVDETWTVAIADGEGGWVTAGTWEPLTNAEVADWAEVGPAVDADELHLELYNRAVAAEGELALRSPVGPGLSREDLGRRVADVCVQWSREDDEREGATATWDALNSHRRELYMRVGEALFGLGMTWSPAPVLDGETQAVGSKGWYGALECAHREAAQRASSWWEAAKEWYRAFDRQQRKLVDLDVERINLTAVRDELAAQRDAHRARADAAEAKLATMSSSPLPDSETELPEGFSWQWGVKTAEGYFLPRRSEAEARKEVEDAVPGFYFLARHPVGPWKVVSE